MAFEGGVPGGLGGEVLAISLAFFTYSTLLGWAYYGEKAIEYVLKERSVIPYRVIFTAVVFIGAVIKLDTVWLFADVMNGLMAFPNLIALLGLSNVVVAETKRYLSQELKNFT